MSARVCYLSRADRGARITAARVVGGPLDDRWESGNGTADPAGEARAAAAWVGERLAQSGGERSLRLLCLDTDGAACSWLTAPSGSPAVVAAAMLQNGAAAGEGDGGASAVWGDLTPGDASLQALATMEPAAGGAAGAGRRLAALAVPDVSARLFLDALDERGVAADGVVSIWHGLATAWDPGGAAGRAASGGTSLRAERVIDTTSPATAVVALDPEGRLIWSWAGGGSLLAAGSLRLRAGAGAEDGPTVTEDDIARLVADWLAWSAQIGVAPSRIICVGPRAGREGLSAGEIGESLGRAWPGATVDFAVHDDPIGATLQRLASLPVEPAAASSDPRAGLVPLSNRPSRAHRAMFHAAGATLLLGAAGLTGLAWRAFSAAGQLRADAAAKEDERRSVIAAAVPAAANDPFPEALLNDELSRLRAAQSAGRELDAAKPILQELDVITAVLTPDTRPETISLHNSMATLTVQVPNLQVGSELLDSLSSIGGSSLEWKPGEQVPAGDKLRFYINGAWRTPGTSSP